MSCSASEIKAGALTRRERRTMATERTSVNQKEAMELQSYAPIATMTTRVSDSVTLELGTVTITVKHFVTKSLNHLHYLADSKLLTAIHGETELKPESATVELMVVVIMVPLAPPSKLSQREFHALENVVIDFANMTITTNV